MILGTAVNSKNKNNTILPKIIKQSVDSTVLRQTNIKYILIKNIYVCYNIIKYITFC